MRFQRYIAALVIAGTAVAAGQVASHAPTKLKAEPGTKTVAATPAPKRREPIRPDCGSGEARRGAGGRVGRNELRSRRVRRNREQRKAVDAGDDQDRHGLGTDKVAREAGKAGFIDDHARRQQTHLALRVVRAESLNEGARVAPAIRDEVLEGVQVVVRRCRYGQKEGREVEREQPRRHPKAQGGDYTRRGGPA